MPVNPGVKYGLAQAEYSKAKTIEEKIKALEKVLSVVPKHKSSEGLQKEIKTKLSKLREQLEKSAKKGKGKQVGIKREGAARVVLVGTTLSGKSVLLKKITNAKPKITGHEFTTKEPEVGMMDYNGINIQVIEIPAIVEDFYNKEKGGFLLSIIKESDLIVLLYKNEKGKELVLNELYKNNIDLPITYYNGEDNIKELVWKRLNLIHVYTKQPSKKPDYPPVALKINSTVGDLAGCIHKDFLKGFDYAKVNGKSVKFKWQRCGLDHKLEDGDVVEFHLK